MTTNALPLSMANEGDRVKVVGLLAGMGLSRKVTEMGLNVGAEIEVRQREKGAVIVARAETRYAIGAGMAHKIMVIPIEPSK